MSAQEDEPSGRGGRGGRPETRGEKIPAPHAGRKRDPFPCSERSGGGGGGGDANDRSSDPTLQSADSSRDPIIRQARDLLIKFIVDRALTENGPEVAAALTAECRDVGAEPLEDRRVVEVANCLKKIADDLENNVQLQRLIQNIPVNSPKDYLFGVACKLFDDGIFNWGRVATLFYFAYKLVIRAYTSCVPDYVKTLLGWMLELIKLYIVPWIKQQGGWEAVIVYVRWAACQSRVVKVASLLMSAFLVYRQLRKA
uniref:Apoptosis regulator BAX-like n=1 Tax=Petromyzon marinus TaxID=7757 RepID=A0AAJ7WXJ3_PETMA|nr:apoptosis regulator BAX-like [Petromyzon marinus]